MAGSCEINSMKRPPKKRSPAKPAAGRISVNIKILPETKRRLEKLAAKYDFSHVGEWLDHMCERYPNDPEFEAKEEKLAATRQEPE
jgi:hypothetical protein